MLQLKHCHFFSVCDGHGHNGHDVSGLLKHRLPVNIETGLKQAIKLSGVQEGQQPDRDIVSSVLTKAFSETNKEVSNSGTDVRFSGSTCVSVLTFGKRIYCANVGDSRAIVIKANNPNSDVSQIQVKSASRDHKPDDPSESKVILENNGRIDSYRDEHGN